MNGWQSQPNGNTIQDYIEARLRVIFDAEIRIHGSGRTDAGVHAKAHPFHFDAPWAHSSSDLLRALSVGLPAAIQIWDVTPKSDRFHARFSAKAKHYCYRYYPGDAPPWEARYCWSLGRRTPDIQRMHTAARSLLGTHDFSAMGASRQDTSTENPVKTMWRMEVRQRGARIEFHTTGSGYLYKMVRSLAGALLQCGLGKLQPDELTEIVKAKTRVKEIETAPAKGLWLEKVYYRKPTVSWDMNLATSPMDNAP